MAISEQVCGVHGHKIESLRTGDKLIQIPSGQLGSNTSILAGQYATMCTACGLTLEEVRELDKKPPKRTRNRKPKTVIEEQPA